MSVRWELEEGNLCVIYVSSKLNIKDMVQAQNESENVINESGRIKILIILENFTGWETEEGWEDNAFAERNDKNIDKMAIVGNEKWRDLVNLFTLKDFRSIPIEYFDENQQADARKWLNGV